LTRSRDGIMSDVSPEFSLVKEHGEGLYGVVWEGIQTAFQRKVAIKRINEEYEAQADALKHARALAPLGNDNIVVIHVVTKLVFPGETKPADVVIMEWLEGQTLAKMLEVGGITKKDVVRILRSVASALKAMHNADLSHNDLHAENIIISDERVKVIDACVRGSNSMARYSTNTTKMRKENDLASFVTLFNFCTFRCSEPFSNHGEISELLRKVTDADQLSDVLEKLESPSASSNIDVPLTDLRKAGLNDHAIEVLKIYGDIILKSGDNTDLVSNRDVLNEAVNVGLSFEDALNAVRLLGELGFVKLPYGHTATQAFVTTLGFDQYLNAFDPKRQVKMDLVVMRILQYGDETTNAIVAATGLPIPVVNHFLDVLSKKDLLEIRPQYLETRVVNASQRLINMYADKI
jgi:serine/threonine protein kinase